MLVGPVYLVENALGDWRSVHLYPSHRRIDVLPSMMLRAPVIGLWATGGLSYRYAGLHLRF